MDAWIWRVCSLAEGAVRSRSSREHRRHVARTKGARDIDYDGKRRQLLEKITLHLMRREGARASLRDLASAAGVSGPTLRHYFGDRQALIAAVLEECLRRGRPGLDAQRQSGLPLAASIHAYAADLVAAMTAEKSVRLGDMVALSLAEGFLDPAYSRPALDFILEPTLQGLEARLAEHAARGELREGVDLRMAALMLVSPLMLACLHQQQLDGRHVRPLALDDLIESACEAFLHAFGQGDAIDSRPRAELARA